MTVKHWIILVNSLFDHGASPDEDRQVRGPCLSEWMLFVHHDWDEIDRDLLDMETIGGG